MLEPLRWMRMRHDTASAPPTGGTEVPFHQSGPRTSLPLGDTAAQKVATLMPLASMRTLASPMHTFMPPEWPLEAWFQLQAEDAQGLGVVRKLTVGYAAVVMALAAVLGGTT